MRLIVLRLPLGVRKAAFDTDNHLIKCFAGSSRANTDLRTDNRVLKSREARRDSSATEGELGETSEMENNPREYTVRRSDE